MARNKFLYTVTLFPFTLVSFEVNNRKLDLIFSQESTPRSFSSSNLKISNPILDCIVCYEIK